MMILERWWIFIRLQTIKKKIIVTKTTVVKQKVQLTAEILKILSHKQ